jgi:hypothetical protein
MSRWLAAPWIPLLINDLKSGRRFHGGLATANSWRGFDCLGEFLTTCYR